MVFSSFEFIIFFIIVAVLLWLTKLPLIAGRIKEETLRSVRHVMLLAVSYIFCGWTDWRFALLLIVLTVLTYFAAIGIKSGKYKTFSIILGVVSPIAVLAFFKYFNFFIDSFNDLAGTEFKLLNIILPVGISFYIFQTLAYVIDVYRGRAEVTHSFIKYALHIAFFPKLISGPLVKTSEFMAQLEENRNISLDNVKVGLQIFLFGLFKKIVLADNLTVFVGQVYLSPTVYHSVTIILAVISYSIQIYLDFSGYSDMAVGCAKCLGYDLPRNFNMPYVSKNVTEFWKRWHISLSEWLQQYLYISLGGNRKGNIRTYLNLLITMTLGGLWHGANWNFILWGVVQGLALCVHKLFMKFRNGKPVGKLRPFTDALSIAGTFVFTSLSWFVLFRLENISDIGIILKSIFVWHDGVIQIYSWSVAAIIIVVVCTAFAVVKSRRSGDGVTDKKKLRINGFYPVFDLNKFWPLVYVLLMICLIMALAYTDSNPFIYFQF